MKAKEIEVGKVYMAKVSHNIVPVRVDRITDNGLRINYGGRSTGSATRYHVTNLKTRRTTVFRSAAKFRRPATEAEVAGLGFPRVKPVDGVPGPKAVSDLFRL